MRVVSLLPSATETLCLILGSEGRRAGVELVGRSHECDHPHGVADRPALTRQATDYAALGSAGVDRAVSEALASGKSLYSLDEEGLAGLRPDLIITQDLCEVCSIDLAAVRRAAARMPSRPEVLSLNPATLEDVLDDVARVGAAIGLARAAEEAVAALRERMDTASGHVNPFADGPSVLFLEWTDPPFVGGHWTPQLIERAGATHPLNPTGAAAVSRSALHAGAGAGADGSGSAASTPGAPKSRRVTHDEIVASAPEAVIVCPCGLTLSQALGETETLAREDWFRSLPAFASGRVAVVDGSQMFNRPGPRLVDAFEWLCAWLGERPGEAPAGFPWEAPACGR